MDRFAQALEAASLTTSSKGYAAFQQGWNAAHTETAILKKPRNPHGANTPGFAMWWKGYNAYNAGVEEVLETIVERRTEWAWQPFGPDPDPRSSLSFVTPGSHSRGFPIIKVSGKDKDHIRAGGVYAFRYRSTEYVLEGAELREVAHERA